MNRLRLTTVWIAMAGSLPFAVHSLAAQVTNCKAKAAQQAAQFRVNTPFQKDMKITELDPDRLCVSNRGAPGNRKDRGVHSNDERVCEMAYLRAKEAVEEYQKLAERACEEAVGIDFANLNGAGLLTSEIVRKASAAAAANLAAAEKLKDAKKQVAEFGDVAAQLRDRYQADLKEIIAAEKNFEADKKEISERQDLTEIERKRWLGELDKTKKTSNLIENHRYAGERGKGALVLASGGEKVSSYRGNASEITGYREKLEATPRGIGLVKEQQFAWETSQAFQQQAEREIQQRTKIAQDLQRYAASLDPIARNNTESIVKGPGGANNNTISSANNLPNLQNAMAMTQAGSALANQVGAQSVAGGGMGQVASSVWQEAAGAVQKFAEGAKAPESSKLISPNSVGGTGLVQEGPEKKETTDPETKLALHSDPGINRRGDTSLGGSGDLPLESATAASRALASEAKIKLGEGFAGDAKTYGKKKKGESDAKEKAACPTGQDCAAIAAATGVQFQKGGSLGIPLVGASDPALNAAGALDNLFGPIPALDSATGLPTTPVTMNASSASWGSGGELNVGANGGGEEKLSAPEVAPANSRSLFVRVRLVHEKAQKKGAVSLFHKKI